ncbi:MAG TPA: hypothetical protein EYN67_17795 [Flavobacteriales bacterium]|nr:hypothetical protein [Flavobacteriales bacterium]
MDITHDQLQNAFVLFMGCLFVFVLIREIVCWYWKINKGILLQEKSIKNQEKIIELLTPAIIDNNIPYINRHEVK